MSTDYSAMPTPPGNASAATVFAHTLDAAGFRYYWASSGIHEAAFSFAPAPECMTLGELVQHTEQLAAWMHLNLVGTAAAASGDGPKTARSNTLQSLAASSAKVRAMTDEELMGVRVVRPDQEDLPVWNLLNGPLADFLTHVGQISTWRRIAGCPAPAPQYLLGLAPINDSSAPNAAEPRKGLHIKDADLTESTFRDIALTGSTFDDVSLAGAKFNNATFAGATIHNVDLSNVNITDANTEGLRIDGKLISG